MSWIAFVLIFLSAVLHASWNLLAKKSQMSIAFYALLCSVAAVLCLHIQLWTPINVLDLPVMFWVFLAGSVASDIFYCLGLSKAYRSLDMSIAYPMMRSIPLLLTAFVTSLLGWGEELSWLSITGMFIIFAGCICMPLAEFSDFNIRKYLSFSMLFVLAAACGTTGYTIFDSRAQEVLLPVAESVNAGKPLLAMTYYSTREICLSLSLNAIALLSGKEREIYIGYVKNLKITPFLAGVFAAGTSILVLVAMNYVTNLSYIQGFRQIGLVIAFLFGICILKEKFFLPKCIGVILIVSGLVISVL